MTACIGNDRASPPERNWSWMFDVGAYPSHAIGEHVGVLKAPLRARIDFHEANRPRTSAESPRV